MKKHTLKVLLIILTVVVILSFLGACAPPAAPSAAPEKPKENDKVSIRLSWRWKAEFAPIVLTADKGYFAEQGLDVEILEGKSSGDVVPLIANKQDTFGYLNLTTVSIGISKGMPIKVVAGLMGKHPSTLAFFADKNIKEPKDLEGKTIALSPGEAFAVIYPAFAKKWNIDTTKVTTVQLDPTAKNQIFLEGKVDVLPVYANNELPLLRSKTDKKIDAISPADFGFNTIANGIITNVDTIKEKPDMVRRFVAAINKGYAYSVDHPDEALDAVLKRSPELAAQPRPVLIEQVKLTLALIYSDATKGKPIGWMADDDWNRSLDLLYENKGIEKRPLNTDVFTNEFVPAK